MIEPQVAARARSLLSNVIVSLVEDEHVDVVTAPPRGGDDAHAERLQILGSDIALALAMAVILRRSREARDVEA